MRQACRRSQLVPTALRVLQRFDVGPVGEQKQQLKPRNKETNQAKPRNQATQLKKDNKQPGTNGPTKRMSVSACEIASQVVPATRCGSSSAPSLARSSAFPRATNVPWQGAAIILTSRAFRSQNLGGFPSTHQWTKGWL